MDMYKTYTYVEREGRGEAIIYTHTRMYVCTYVSTDEERRLREMREEERRPIAEV